MIFLSVGGAGVVCVPSKEKKQKQITADALCDPNWYLI